MIQTYFTTYEDDLNLKLTKIKQEDFIDVKFTSATYGYDDAERKIEYGFLVIYKVD